MTILIGCFSILKISICNDPDEIKKAYKKMAALYHPDKNLQNMSWAEENFKLVVNAYQTIINELNTNGIDVNRYSTNNQSFHFDTEFKTDSNIPNYWETIKKSKNPRDLVRLVLHYLENEKEAEALQLFEHLTKTKKSPSEQANPLSLLKSRDYYDCCYLLAEAYENTKNVLKAISFYVIVFQRKRRELHSRKLAIDIRLHITSLYQNHIFSNSAPKESIFHARKMTEQLFYSQIEKIPVYKKIIRWSLKLDQTDEALTTLKEILKIAPNTKGLDRIFKLLNTNPESIIDSLEP